MRIGVPKEIKTQEYRVGLVPLSVSTLVSLGHELFVETQAGVGSGFTDEDYQRAGAQIAKNAQEIFNNADLIVKVKEPQREEYPLLKKGQVLFAYLHLASDLIQTKALLDSGVIAIAYETVSETISNNVQRLPLLAPMSEIAGRMSVQIGAHFLEKTQKGRGILLSGVPGVPAGNVIIIGGGSVGTNAARIALGLKAHVTIIDRSLKRLQELEDLFPSRIQTVLSTSYSLNEYLMTCDLLIGAVLIPGAKAPKVITQDNIRHMKPGSVFVDVSIDQGGSSETSRPTTQDQPTYLVDDVIHYCVTNIPSAVPRTSTLALNNATLPYVIKIAQEGYQKALLSYDDLKHGLNVYKGVLTNRAVAEAMDPKLGHSYVPPEIALHS